jgi:hypothetical protein
MATQTKRRYKDARLPEYKLYNDEFDHLLLNSKVFNSDKFSAISTIFWDRNAIETEIKILQEASVPELRKQLQECESRFESYCQQREAAGYDRPTAWPPHLLKDRCRAEARLDVTQREIEFLQSKLATLFVEPERKQSEDRVLAYGPIGTGKLTGGVLTEIDGQRTELIDTVLVITSEASPYRGMRVRDYREFIVKPYCDARNRQLRELTEQRLTQLRERGTSNITIRTSLRKIDKANLPQWPKAVRNYLLPQEESSKAEENEDL